MTQPTTQQEPAFYIVWPDCLWLTERKARVWLSDAIANGEIDGTGVNAETDDINEVVRLLHESGVITLTKRKA